MTIGTPDGHFFMFAFSVISCPDPPFPYCSVLPLLFCPSFTVLCCSVLPLLFCSVPSFPTRSRIPPVILSEHSESKDLLKDTRPATTRETE